MNIDEIISRLRKPERQDYLDYLMALNPTLIHFLNFFTQNPKKSKAWFTQLSENFFRKIRGRDAAPKQCKSLILSGAINLIRRNDQDELLTRCNELIYEEVLLQPLPQRIFSTNYIPNQQDLSRFRAQQLSTPMCLVLDLIFQEKLQIQETAKLLRLSENVFEPFLFTVVHKLLGEIPIEDENELESFTQALYSERLVHGENKFVQQLFRLRSFLALDIRSRLDQVELLNLCEKYFPASVTEAQLNTSNISPTKEPSSLIDKIKKRNEELGLEDAAKQFAKPDSPTDIEIYNPIRSVNTNLFNYAKYASVILVLFISFTFYQTIFETNEIPRIAVNNSIPAVSLSNLHNNLDKSIGVLITTNDEKTVTKMQWIIQRKYPALLSIKPDIDVQIAENTKLLLRNADALYLKFGSIKITSANSKFKVFCDEGMVHINGKNSSAHIAKQRQNYSIAGNLKGEVSVESEFIDQKIQLEAGQQIIFGKSQSNKKSSYNSAYFQTVSNPAQFNRRKLQVHLPQTQRNSISNEELEDVLLSVEEIKKKPSVRQKDYMQKL